MWKRLIITAVLLVIILMAAGLTITAQDNGPLTAAGQQVLALRQIAPDDITGQQGAILSLEQRSAGLTTVPVTGQADAVHVLGWSDAATLLYLQRAAAPDDGEPVYDLVAYTPGGETILNTVIGSGLPADQAYALTPAGTRLIGWPSAPNSMADFDAVTVYEAATLAVLATIDTTAANVKGGQLAGLTDERAYFITNTPGDGLLILDLTTNTIEPLIDLLAAGDDAETVLSATLLPGQTLAVVGRVDPKGLAAVYTIPLEADGQPVVDAAAGERPLAQATAQPLPDLMEAQRVFFSNDGTMTAVVAAAPGDFSSSQIYITMPDADPQPMIQGSAFDGCAIFTPDDAWLLFVDPTRESVLAVPTDDPTGFPQSVWSGSRVIDLCETAWPPAPTAAPEPTTDPTPAPTGELSLNRAVTGQITAEQASIDYPVSLTAEETVTFTMQRVDGDLDALLILLDPAGDELLRNDDAPTQVGDTTMNAQILDFTVPETGVYTIRATRFFEAEGPSTGAFRLSLSNGEAVVEEPATDPTLIVGETVKGVIDDDSYLVSYDLALAAGETITINMTATSGDLDPFLNLLGPNGDILHVNDDAIIPIGDSIYNAQIEAFTALQAGTYVVQATRFDTADGNSSGAFDLTVLPAEDNSMVVAAAPPVTGNLDILPGDVVAGTITDAAAIIPYSISLEAGAVITITMEQQSGDLDPLLILYDPAGNEVERNDDAAQTVGDNTYNAQIINFTASQTGTYTIEATRYGQAEGDSTGQFQLALTASSTSSTAGTTLTVGASVDGQITASSGEDSYPLPLEAGQSVTITLEATSGDLDAQVILYNAAGDELVRNDDAQAIVANNSLNAQIVNFVATETATYTVIATRYGESAGGTTGGYQLRISSGTDFTGDNLVTGPALTVGDEAMGMISASETAIEYTLPLETGQTVTITMQQVNGNLDPYLILIGPDGSQVTDNDDAEETVGGNTLNAQLTGFRAPSSGTYTIQATRFGEENGSTSGQFHLSVTAGEAGPIGGGTSNEGTLTVGGAVEGQITDTQPVINYTIQLENNQTITVTMERQGGALDATLTILDEAGNPVATNDDAGTQVGDSELNAQIAGFTATSSGTYTIQATRFGEASGSTTGPFRLTVSTGETSGSTGGAEISNGALFAEPITVGSILRDTIADEPYNQVQYPISLTAGDTIGLTVEATSGDLDTTLSIYDPFDDLVAYNDDAAISIGESAYNSQIISYTAPLTGEYTVVVSRFDGDDGTTSGTYTLQVTESVPVEAIAGGVLTVDVIQVNELTATVYAVDYIIMLDEGQIITVTMEALDNTLDPTLIIYDATDNEVAYNDDADEEVTDSVLDSQIAGFVAPAAGQYTIRATRYFEEGGSSIGRFQINVTAGNGPGSGGSSK